MIDRFFSQLLLCASFCVAVAYAVRAVRVGVPRYERVERAGGSALLGVRTMTAAYWSLQPVARVLVRVRVSAAQITLASLVLGALAGVALATGRFGAGAVLAAAAALGDALDGLVARQTKTASKRGELLDATVDRYQETFFLGGVAVAARAEPILLVLVLFALLGSWMVSYASAKAEALGVAAPRGAMRRPERAAYLIGGAAITPLLGPWLEEAGAPAHAPMLAAAAVVAAVANVSAVRRLLAIGREVAP